MYKILYLIFIISSAITAQSTSGDLRTDKTDTLYIRADIDVQGDEFIGLKQQDIFNVVEESVKRLNMVVVQLKSSDSNPEEYLSISIYLIKNYYTAIAEYKRKVLYRARSDYYETPAPTWRRMIGGGHGSEKKYILDVVNGIADSFTKQFKEQNSLE
jgi:hypothetical protein